MVTLNGSPPHCGCLSPNLSFPLAGAGENQANSLSGRSFEHHSTGSFHRKSAEFNKSPISKPLLSKWTAQAPLLARFSKESSSTIRRLRHCEEAELIAHAKQMTRISSFEDQSPASVSAPENLKAVPLDDSLSDRCKVYIPSLSFGPDDVKEKTKSYLSKYGDAVCYTNDLKNGRWFDKSKSSEVKGMSDILKEETKTEPAQMVWSQSRLQQGEDSETESISFYCYSEDMEPQDMPKAMLDSTSHILKASTISSSVSVEDNEAKHADKSSLPKPRETSPQVATYEDAKRYGIPVGYSLEYWDREEEPIGLLGCVFGASSLGRWIHGWAVKHYGKTTPIAELAEEFRHLLVELSTKMKIAGDSVTCVAGVDDRRMLEDFLEAGDRLTDRLCSLLQRCEAPILKIAKSGRSLHAIEGSATAFVQAIFGREHELERTEQLMASMRLWAFRYDVNCQDILHSIRLASEPATAPGSDNSISSFSQGAPIKSSPLPEWDRSSSANSMDGDGTDITTSDLSCLSDDSGKVELGTGHPFLDEFPGLVEFALQELEMWCAERRRGGSPDSPDAKNRGNITEPSPQQRQPKRDRTTEDGTGLGDDGRLSTTRQGKKSKRDDSEEKRLLLACPFYKKDKFRHKGCLRYQLTRIKDVKQHLCRRHMQPQFCPLCGLEFESQSEQRDHIRTQVCSRREIQEPEGITEDQKRSLSSRVGRTMTLEQQWYAVWDVVFPDLEHPSSVYVQDEIVETLCNFQEFFSLHGQTLIAERLRSPELPYNMPNEERDLAAFLAMTATEIVDILIERYTSSLSASASDEQETTPPALVDDDSATRNGPASIDPHTQHISPMSSFLPLPETGSSSKGQVEHDNLVFNLAPAEDSLAWNGTQDANLGFDTCLDDFTTLGTFNEQLE